MHDADVVASLVMLHHAARTRSSVVREAMYIISLGDTPPINGGHALSARRGLSVASSGRGLVGSTTSAQDVTAGVLSSPRFRRRRLSEVHEEYSDCGHDLSEDNLSNESAVKGCFQHPVPGNGASCVLEQEHPAGLCSPSSSSMHTRGGSPRTDLAGSAVAVPSSNAPVCGHLGERFHAWPMSNDSSATVPLRLRCQLREWDFSSLPQYDAVSPLKTTLAEVERPAPPFIMDVGGFQTNMLSPPARGYTQDGNPFWSTASLSSPSLTSGAVVASGRCLGYVSTDSCGILQDIVDCNLLPGSSRELPAGSLEPCPFSNFNDEALTPHVLPLRFHVSGAGARPVDPDCAQEDGSVVPHTMLFLVSACASPSRTGPSSSVGAALISRGTSAQNSA